MKSCDLVIGGSMDPISSTRPQESEQKRAFFEAEFSLERSYSRCCEGFPLLGRWKVAEGKEVELFLSSLERVEAFVTRATLFRKEVVERISAESIQMGLNGKGELFFLKENPFLFAAVLTDQTSLSGEKKERRLTFIPRLAGAADQEELSPFAFTKKKLSRIISNPRYSNAEEDLHFAFENVDKLTEEVWKSLLEACSIFANAILDEVEEEEKKFTEAHKLWENLLLDLKSGRDFFIREDTLLPLLRFFDEVLVRKGGEKKWEEVFESLIQELERIKGGKESLRLVLIGEELYFQREEKESTGRGSIREYGHFPLQVYEAFAKKHSSLRGEKYDTAHRNCSCLMKLLVSNYASNIFFGSCNSLAHIEEAKRSSSQETLSMSFIHAKMFLQEILGESVWREEASTLDFSWDASWQERINAILTKGKEHVEELQALRRQQSLESKQKEAGRFSLTSLGEFLPSPLTEDPVGMRRTSVFFKSLVTSLQKKLEANALSTLGAVITCHGSSYGLALRSEEEKFLYVVFDPNGSLRLHDEDHAFMYWSESLEEVSSFLGRLILYRKQGASSLLSSEKEEQKEPWENPIRQDNTVRTYLFTRDALSTSQRSLKSLDSSLRSLKSSPSSPALKSASTHSVKKELLSTYKKQLLQLLDSLRDKLTERGQIDRAETYLGLAMQFFQRTGNLEEQITMLLERGDFCLQGAQAKKDFEYYQKASHYYAAVCQLIQKERKFHGKLASSLEEKAHLAWSSLLRLQGQYIERYPHNLEKLLHIYTHKSGVDAWKPLSQKGKEALFHEVEDLADYLGARGCYAFASKFYQIAYSLSKKLQWDREDLLHRQEEMRDFESSLSQKSFRKLPEKLVEKARIFSQRLTSIREETKKLLNGAEFSLEKQKEISASYRALLVDLFTRSALFLEPEKKYSYALVGVGSLARNEMCPFSDVEVALLIEEKTLEKGLKELSSQHPFLSPILQEIQVRQTDNPLLSFEECVQGLVKDFATFKQIETQAKSSRWGKGQTLLEALKYEAESNSYVLSLIGELERLQLEERLSLETLIQKELQKQESFVRLHKEIFNQQKLPNRLGRDFFRTLAELFTLHMIALGETKFTITGGEELVPAGFSLDVSNNLFHLCELPEKLAFRQKKGEEDPVQLNVLRSVEFLTGEKALFERYQTQLQTVLDAHDGLLRKKHALLGIEDYFKIQFAHLEEAYSVDIKTDLLRFTVLELEALALYYGVDTSCHTIDKLEALCQRGVIAEAVREPFHRYLEFAFGLRSKAHLLAGKEQDAYTLAQEEQEIVISAYETLLKPLKETLTHWLEKQETALSPVYFAKGHFHYARKKLTEKNTVDLFSQVQAGLVYVERAACLHSAPLYLKFCGQLYFYLGQFDKAIRMWEKNREVIDEILLEFSKRSEKEILSLLQNTPFLDPAPEFFMQEKVFTTFEQCIKEREHLTQWLQIAEEQAAVQKALQAGFMSWNIQASLPFSASFYSSFESGKEKQGTPHPLSVFLQEDFTLLWQESLATWLKAATGKEERFTSLLHEFYTMLPRRYRQLLKKELVFSYPQKLPLLSDFSCEEGYIFSAMAKREGWLQSFKKEALAVSMSFPLPEMEGVHLGKGALQKEAQEALFQGKDLRKTVRWGNHNVHQRGTAHFKQNPESPGDEYAVFILNHLITGQGSPPIDLLRVRFNPQEEALILISESVTGAPLHELLTKKALGKINKRQFSQMVLMALLTDPEDGKPDNYVAHTCKGEEGDTIHIIGVDNDHVFVKPLIKSGWIFQKEELFIKTILFCFDEMHEEIDPAIKEHFLSLDPAALLEEWLEGLIFYNKRVQELFDLPTLNKYWGQGILLPFFMHRNQVLSLHEKMTRLQSLFRKANSHLDLLKSLDIRLGSLYEAALQRPLSPLERFRELTKHAYRQQGNAFLTQITTADMKKETLKSKLKDMAQFLTPNFLPEEGLKAIQGLSRERRYRGQTKKQIEEAWEKGETPSCSVFLQEEVLKEKDWSLVPSSYLKKLANTSFRKVSLKNFTQLNDQDLVSFLQSCVHPLTEKVEIHTLNLQGCSSLTTQSVWNIIQNCPSLQKLSLEGVPLKNATFGIQTPYLRVLNLKNCPSLDTLSVRHASLRILLVDGCTELKNLTLECPNLVSFSIKGCSALLSPSAYCYLYPQTPINVSQLSLLMALYQEKPPFFEWSKTMIQSDALLKILKNALHSHSSTKKLRMGLAEECSAWTEKEEPFFHKMELHTLPNLQTLEMQGLKEVHIGSLSACLLQCTSLKKLHLQGSAIGEEGALLLADVLLKRGQLRGLTSLNLNGNRIGDRGMLSLAQTLEKDQALLVLDLSSNAISDEGIEALAKALIKKGLANHPTLTHLHLSNNNIGDKGCESLQKFLRGNTTLVSLDVSRNLFGEKGAEDLHEGLLHNTTLTSLNLQNCPNLKASSLKPFLRLTGLKELHVSPPLLRYRDSLNRNLFHWAVEERALSKIETWISELSFSPLELNEKDAEDKTSLQLALTAQNQEMASFLIQRGARGEGLVVASKKNPSLLQALREDQIAYGSYLLIKELEQRHAFSVLGLITPSQNLVNVNIHGTKLGDQGAEKVAAFLKTSPALRTLYLIENEIGETGGALIGEALGQNTLLTTLHIRFNRLGKKGGEGFGKGLLQNKTLTYLDMSRNELEDLGAVAIGQALSSNPSLIYLDLNRNEIAENGGAAIGKGLMQNSTLQFLNLKENNLKEQGIKAFSEALITNKTLTALDISYNNLGEKEGVLLGAALVQNKTLRKIDLGHNKLSEKGGIAVTEVLKANATLRDFSLRFNTIGEKGALVLAEALSNNRTLTILDYGANGIGDKGAMAIATALKKNPTLLNLDLTGSYIGTNMGDKGASALADALTNNDSLTALDLSDNDIYDAGALALTEALRKNTRLLTFDISGNQVTKKGRKLVEEIAATKPSFQLKV